METENPGRFVHRQPHPLRTTAGEYYRDSFGNDASANGVCHDVTMSTATKAENPKKKPKKWSLSGLFKKRRSKSSDTDSSCETDGKKTGFLSRNSRRRHNGGSRKVVGKFEAIVLPKDDLPSAGIRNGTAAPVSRCDGIELYDASPNVMKRNRRDDASPSNRDTKTREQWRTNRGSGGSLDTASRRSEKSKVKARAEAMRDRLRDESSSSDEQRPSSSSRNSNGSLPPYQAVDCGIRNGSGTGTGSRGRKSRVNRRRRSNDEPIVSAAVSAPASSSFCYADGLSPQPSPMPTSPKSRWVARVVYQQSNDYPMRYTARTRSATSSPMSSPLAKPKTFQSCSLPSKYSSFGDRDGATLLLPPPPPSPPPRNPNRKTVASATMAARNYSYPDRPSSYAFDANARQKDISSFIRGRRRDANYVHEDNDDDDDDDNRAIGRRYKSQSQVELRQPPRPNAFVDFGARTCPKIGDRYPLPSDIYINRNLFADEKPNVNPSTNINGHSRSQNAKLFDSTHPNGACLSKANEIGIPVMNSATVAHGSTVSRPNHNKSAPVAIVKRPLSAVSEASTDVDLKSKPRNLEEALVELEQIYNSLKLSDDDLLDRADRRDLQAALKMHHPKRDYYEDSDSDDDRDICDASNSTARSPSGRSRQRPRLPTSRRSAVPDAVADDMAYRKLRRKQNGASDAKSNPNLVSQAGSFLLMSPTFSPPPLVDVPPASPLPPYCAKEPDVTLDDVVFRNIRRVNNTLRVSDPQPPFGIPLSPIPAAPLSDYLHAVPSDKYRSTFNPSRVPDVVKDDLAFRSLRKDVRNDGDSGVARAPTAASGFNKRRAVRSLSANVVSLLGQRSASDRLATGAADSVFDEPSVSAYDKCASYHHLPDHSSQEWPRWRRPLPWQTNEPEPKRDDDHDEVDETLDLMAEETRALGEALEKKLRDLETRSEPQTKPFASLSTTSNGVDRDVFAKRVVVHKPITLSAFQFGHVAATNEEENARNETVADKRPQLKLVERLENVDSDTNRGTDIEMESERRRCRDQDQVHVHIVEPCPDFNWNDVRIVKDELHRQQQPQSQPPPTQQRSDYKCDKTTENSSSGVSSTSNTPDSARKCRIVENDPSDDDNRLRRRRRHHSRNRNDSDNDKNNENDNEIEILSKKILPPLEHASQQFSQEFRDAFECPDDAEVVEGATVAGGTRTPAKKDFCSRFEITLVTPQPAGTSPNSNSTNMTHSFENWPPNDAFIHLIYLAACLCEFFFATYSIYELLLVLISSLAYFALNRS